MKKLALALLLVGGVAVAKDSLAPIVARPIKVETVGKDTFVTVAAGSEAGVAKELACAFVGAGGTPIVGTCALIRIDKKTSVVKTDLARAAIDKATVKIGPIVR